jgi:hypothetical protein
VNEPRLPLLCWWAIESKCGSDRDEVLRLFENSPFWSEPMVEKHILDRLMRRFAAGGTRQDLLTCAELLELSPGLTHSRKLMKGFEEAFKGRSLTGLPEELIAAMERHNVGSDALRLRQGKPEAVAQALKIIADASANRDERLRFIDVLGEVKQPASVPVLLRVVLDDGDPLLRQAAVTALLQYDNPNIGAEVTRAYPALPPEVRAAARTLLASRAIWSLQFVQALEGETIKASDVPLESVRKMKLHKNERLAQLISKHWPQTGSPTPEALQQQVQRMAGVIRAGKGDPIAARSFQHELRLVSHALQPRRQGRPGPDQLSTRRSRYHAVAHRPSQR